MLISQSTSEKFKIQHFGSSNGPHQCTLVVLDLQEVLAIRGFEFRGFAFRGFLEGFNALYFAVQNLQFAVFYTVLKLFKALTRKNSKLEAL